MCRCLPKNVDKALNCPNIANLFIDLEIDKSNNKSTITVLLPMGFNGRS